MCVGCWFAALCVGLHPGQQQSLILPLFVSAPQPLFPCLTPLPCLPAHPCRVTAAWCGDSRAVLGLAVDTPPTTTTTPPTTTITTGDDSASYSDSSIGGNPGADDGAEGTTGTVQQYLVHSLTQDHHPNLPSERRRIEAAGGQVLQLRRDEAGKAAGPHRICGASLDLRPRLSCSRAFGDTSE